MNTTTATTATNEQILVEIAQIAALVNAYEENGQSAFGLVDDNRFEALVEEAGLRGLDETHADAFGSAYRGDLPNTVRHLNG